MKKQAFFTFLGTGGSMGVPLVSCSCSVCTSSSPFNKRFRSSALITVENKNILVDSGPDFRAQALQLNLKKLDAVIFTHGHNDHTAGIDDLRVFSYFNKRPLPCLLSYATLDDIHKRFHYLFEGGAYKGIGTQLAMQMLDKERGEVVFEGLNIRYFTYQQLGTHVNGFRIGNLAYVTDIKTYPESLFEDLKGIDILILSALKLTPSLMHFDVDEAIEFSKKCGASKTWLMHIAHELDHEKINAYLPENIRMAFDGLQIDFEVDMSS